MSSFCLMVCVAECQGTVGFFFFFHLKPELISSIRDPANCPQSYMTNSFLHLLFKKKTTITTKTEKRLVKTFLFVKFEILPRKVLK